MSDKPIYLFTLDLGKSQDYTALTILERTQEGRAAPRYAAVHLERWELRTTYERIVDDCCRLMVRDPIYGRTVLAMDATGVGTSVREQFEPERVDRDLALLQAVDDGQWARAVLGDDGARAEALAFAREPVSLDEAETAVRAMVRRCLAFTALRATVPVLLHGGAEPSTDTVTNTYHVPKRDVVAVTQIVLQEGRLAIAPTLRYVDILARELGAMQAKPTRSGNEVYEAREGEHDDMVLSLAIGLWVGERSAEWDAAM